MYRLSSLILTLSVILHSYGQSPHGDTFKMDCAACHTSSGWLPVKEKLQFDHNTTNFPLEGLHLQVDCKQCHQSLAFASAPSKCVGCHTDIHNMSVGEDCARCHSTQSWIIDNIPELHEQSGFPLMGSHIVASCVDCHLSETSLRFNPIGNDCINCHRDDYQATTNPNHQHVGYSTTCTDCHDPFAKAWTADLINHDFFPLTMGHDNLSCKQCHLTDNYSDASPECVSCHLNDYTATTNPNHAQANFSNNCAECHSTGAWSPSTFDHNTVYPLLGAHAAIANCAQCHTDGYTNTPNTCAGCHLTDYNNTTNPNHTAAHFPTDCKQCHNETAWVPADFDHDGMYFPIYSGKHRGQWSLCTDCHINSSNYSVFSCINCHAHNNQTEVNNDHDEVSGYIYSATSCYTCHPSGSN